MGTSDRIAALVEPILEERGAALYDVELTGAIVRVLVDKPNLDLQELARISQEVSAALDEDDPMPDRFELEVSSPGLERPLRRPDHFRNAIGSNVKIKTTPSTEGDRRVDGVLTDVDDDGFTVLTDSGARRLAFGEVEKARTVFQWGPAPKPGSTRKRER
jgi:ribosome maturation factor RimP